MYFPVNKREFLDKGSIVYIFGGSPQKYFRVFKITYLRVQVYFFGGPHQKYF